ncbi:MAG: hypothetical protein ACFFDN_00975 [Candidatus Hodarchaeota archaeon]
MKEKFFFLLISSIISNMISIIASYILILNLEIVILGYWVFLNTIINLGFLFIDLGFETIHYQYSGKKDFSKYFGTFLMIKAMIIVLNVTITLILIIILDLWAHLNYLLILTFGKVFYEIAKIFLVNLESKIKVFKGFLPRFIIELLRSILIIFFSLNISQFSNPILYLCLLNFVVGIVFIIFILLVSKSDLIIMKPRKNLALNYLKDVKPIVIMALFLVIATYLGNLILAYSFGYEELGYFSIINTYILPQLLFISGCIIPLYLTLFSKYFEKEDLNSVKKLTHIIEKYTSIIVLSIIITVFLNSELIFSIFLPKYTKSIFILYIMVSIPYLIGLSRPYTYQMIAGKNLKTIVKINLFTYISIIFLMIVLIPKNFLGFQTLGLGSMGYALAQTIPWILSAILIRFYTKKYYNIEFQKRILFHIPLAVLSLLIGLFLKNWLFKLFFENLVFLLISSSLIAIAIFLLLLIIINELNRKDLKVFLQMLRVKIYIESLKEEFKI